MAEELKACPFCGGKVREPKRYGEGCKITCHCGAEYSGLVAQPSDLVRCWNRRAQLPSQGGEAVAWRVVGVHPKHRHPHKAVEYSEKTAEGQAAHWRNRGCTVEVTPLYTHPADQVADGVVVRQEVLEQWANDLALHGVGDIEAAQEIDALLANSEGVKP